MRAYVRACMHALRATCPYLGTPSACLPTCLPTYVVMTLVRRAILPAQRITQVVPIQACLFARPTRCEAQRLPEPGRASTVSRHAYPAKIPASWQPVLPWTTGRTRTSPVLDWPHRVNAGQACTSCRGGRPRRFPATGSVQDAAMMRSHRGLYPTIANSRKSADLCWPAVQLGGSSSRFIGGPSPSNAPLSSGSILEVF